MMRRTLALLGVLAVAFALAARADEPASKNKANPDKKSGEVKDKTLLEQRLLEKRFADFKAALLRVKQRLEKGSAEDREKAKALQNALDEIDKKHLDTEFSKMVHLLNSKSMRNIGDVQEAVDQSKKLANEIAKLIDMLREDNRAARLREERKRLEEMIRELEGIIKDQKIERAKAEMKRMEKDDLVVGERNVTDRTAKMRDKLAGKQGKGEGKKADPTAKMKGATKGKGQAGQGKNKGKGEGERKADAGAKGSKGAKGEKKAAAKGQGKGDKAASKGQGKGDKAGSKASPKASKPEKGEGKGKGKGEAESKSAGKGQGKAGDSKGQGQSKGSKSAKSSKGSSKKGSKGGREGDNREAEPGDPSNQKPKDNNNDDTANALKKIQDANQLQKKAIDELEEDKRKKAAEAEDKAIKELEAAKKKLEELLRQTREEELERLLNALENRCRQMLEMQRVVKAGTIDVSKAIEGNPDKKATRANQQDSGRLADKEREIVNEATKAIELIEAEGSAVAFAEVFRQVRTDMEAVQGLLEKTKVGLETQTIEQDIIDALLDMIKALQKAKAQLGQGGGGGGPPPDPKLLDLIAELKMIRAWQVKINSRTKMYGRMYVGKEGEQTADAEIKKKLEDLSERQANLNSVTTKIVKGDNK
jgi:hypothetical protein